MNPARTVLAVLLGYLTLIILEVLGGALLYAARVQPGTPGAVIAGELVVLVAGIIAGAVTARFAPSRPLSHASALALAIVSATSLATAVLRPPAHPVNPAWYPYALGVFGALGAFAGGALASRRVPGDAT